MSDEPFQHGVEYLRPRAVENRRVHVSDTSERRAKNDEIERLTRERDTAREALRISEQRVREHWPERERLRALLRDAKQSVLKAADADCMCVDGPQRCKYCLPHRALAERIDVALSGASHAPETNRDAEDAAKWRAFRNCARLRVVGSAGFTKDAPYRFLTLEMWTQYPGATTTPETAKLVEEFVSVSRSLAEKAKSE